MSAIDPARSALLALDLQSIVVSSYFPETHVIEKMTSAIERARAVGIPVIFVTVEFRPGYPEVDPRNQGFAALTSSGAFLQGAEGTAIHPDVGYRPEDLVVVKRRMSAFAGTELNQLLRARGIDTLIVGGLATGGVVLSTVRSAGDLDYRIVVLSDCCDDFDDEVQRVLLEKVLPHQASVITSDALRAQLG